jgi:hypothetical protein
MLFRGSYRLVAMRTVEDDGVVFGPQQLDDFLDLILAAGELSP